MKIKNMTTTKFVILLSCCLVIISLLSFIPVNNLIFILDIFSHVCRYSSVILFIYYLIVMINVIKEDKKTIYIISTIVLSILYLVCFYFNVLSLFL